MRVMTKVTILVKGWIQGVGYRAFVKRTASQLGLKGLVRNLPESQVEIFCEGTKHQINKLLKMLDYKGRKDDPLSAYVESLKVYEEGEKGYNGPWKPIVDFEIDYGFEIESPVDRALLENLENGTLYVASSRDEMGLFRHETNSNFETMERKYGSISEEMAKMRATFEKLANAYIKRKK